MARARYILTRWWWWYSLYIRPTRRVGFL